MKPSGPGLFFAGRFLITVPISVFVLSVLRFSISSWFCLESCTFLRICPFLPCCPFYWHIIADSSLLWSYVFLCCVLWSLHFHFNFYWFDFSPFVSWWVWLVVCQFYLSSQRTSFWLCWFSLWSLLFLLHLFTFCFVLEGVSLQTERPPFSLSCHLPTLLGVVWKQQRKTTSVGKLNEFSRVTR